MTEFNRPRLASALCAGLFVAGCAGSGTGTGNPVVVMEAGMPCLNQALPSLDTPSELGFSAAEVLTAFAGDIVTPIEWRNGPIDVSGGLLGFGPEQGAGELTISLAYDGGELRQALLATGMADAQDEPVANQDGPVSSTFAPNCRPHLSIELPVTLTTQGGALAETVDTLLMASAADSLELQIWLPLDELAGDLVIDELPVDGAVDMLRISTLVDTDGARGSIDALLMLPGEGDETLQFVTLGSWPDVDGWQPN